MSRPGLYRIGPGDVIDVTFRYTPEFNDEVVVGPDGRLNAKATGVLDAAGMTLAELEQAIMQAALTKLVRPEFTVALKDFDRPHVFIAGEVNQPGRQDLRRPTTALQAILMCGGPKDDAALGRVLIFRRIDADSAEVHVLKLSHFGRHAREENDMLLEPNDMLLVRRDVPSHLERIVKLANLGFYINPLQNTPSF
jgi:polysaccharide biosynthesis/export protein